ncbi:MAG: glycine--tRNA ligase subunit beta, partial [Anaerolineales bacterium]|nr:glycine--tRNA ligase subunit beta [Anaerolineales bacterium]
FFRRIRELAKRVAESYEEQRKGLEYPLLKNAEGKMQNVESPKNSSFIIQPSSFLLEIGVEELPASDVDSAQAYLGIRIPQLLDELHLDHKDIRVFATPRRLTVSVASLSPNQPDREDLVKGPPADKAIVGQTSSLSYTPAAIGFAKKNGVDAKDLQVREQDGGKYAKSLPKRCQN